MNQPAPCAAKLFIKLQTPIKFIARENAQLNSEFKTPAKNEFVKIAARSLKLGNTIKLNFALIPALQNIVNEYKSRANSELR